MIVGLKAFRLFEKITRVEKKDCRQNSISQRYNVILKSMEICIKCEWPILLKIEKIQNASIFKRLGRSDPNVIIGRSSVYTTFYLDS